MQAVALSKIVNAVLTQGLIMEIQGFSLACPGDALVQVQATYDPEEDCVDPNCWSFENTALPEGDIRVVEQQVQLNSQGQFHVQCRRGMEWCLRVYQLAPVTADML